MIIYLLRHGTTQYNVEKRYQGQRDIPLSKEGRACIRRADFTTDVVYVSPLTRARQTAQILFPEARQIVVEDLKEMNFGSFEGRNYVEMEHDPDYLAWVEANCETSCPDGERKDQFCARTCAAFAKLVDQALREKRDKLVIVAHGGTQMAVMERYCVPHHEYYHWCAPNAGGYKLDASLWPEKQELTLLETVQYTREPSQC